MRTLKTYVFAFAGMPLGLYLLWGGEFLGALVFLGIGAGCLLLLLGDHLPVRTLRWRLKAGFWCFAVSIVALAVLVVRVSRLVP
jgi:hypothetical protein